MKLQSKKYFFKTKDMIAISAYLRQIYLSMYRISWASYPELVAYYQKKVMPDTILEYINHSRGVVVPQTIQPLLSNIIRGKKLRNPSIILKNWMLHKIQGGYYLSVEEVQCLLFLLESFSKLLQASETPPPPYDNLHLRIDAFCSYCLEPKLSSKYFESICVEHFMQTPSLNCLSIEAIVGDKNWYQ
jgi:hypothetical protein